MNKSVTLRAPAKINLNLNITGRRDDGYHLLDSVVIFADLTDNITISIADLDMIRLTGIMATELNNTDTTLHQARDIFRKKTGWEQAVMIDLEKRIPVAAGLGGGSADAAAILRGMARLSGITVDEDVMMEMALHIGADVPALMLSWQTSALRMQGIGEVLTPLDFPHQPGILLVNPGVTLSTAAVFHAMHMTSDTASIPTVPHISDASLTNMDLALQMKHGNDMTPAAISLAPAINRILAAVHQCVDQYGGYGVAMSGSGATCFALFPGINDAEQARMAFSSIMPDDQIWCWAGGVMKPDLP
ncbi:MAG: 4-(cytidine 5'-diphospho)-2-C-methyl-D-erythritol kinase [Pseudomonadota bacterium]|nr:4-(cytidine 5'-diphospho)-2-C-methyl-D-erythritol kinase [Pseudomonadota bacterium]